MEIGTKQIVLIFTMAFLGIGLPVAIAVALPYMPSFDKNYLMTFLVCLAGVAYVTYQPWITKLKEYKQAVDAALEKGLQPPSADDFFKHGITFNYWYLLGSVMSFLTVLGITFWAMQSGQIVAGGSWLPNAIVNFGAAVGFARETHKLVP